jgi:hypothetical protein
VKEVSKKPTPPPPLAIKHGTDILGSKLNLAPMSYW